MKKLAGRAGDFLSMVRFSHTLFALPFALTSMVLASYREPPTPGKILWILAAMVGARTAAMGYNRIADRRYDRRNPRTRDRELARGVIPLWQARLLVIFSAGLLVTAAYMLNPLCFYLSPLALIVIMGYSVTKRFTWLTHIVLGLSLGIAPVGTWIAVTGAFALPPIILCLAVVFWVAGFDIIYSCMDYDFDRAEGLFSIPARFGLKTALVFSAVFHLFTVGFLAALILFFPLEWLYLIGLSLIAGILFYEHIIVKPSDLSRVDKAFFDLNGYVSTLFFFFTLADVIFL